METPVSSGVTADQVFQAFREDILQNVGEALKYPQLLDKYAFGIIVFNLEMKIVAMNDSAGDMLGIDAGKASTPIDDAILPNLERINASEQKADFKSLTTEKGQVILLDFLVEAVDGAPSAIVTVVRDANLFKAIADEVLRPFSTVELLYREELEKQRRSAFILKTVLEASSSLILDEVLTSAATSIADTIGTRLCGIYLADKERGVLAMRGGTGRLNDPDLIQAIAEAPLPIDDELAKAAVSSSKPILIEDAQVSELVSDLHKEKLRLKSLLVIPLMARGKMLGLAMIPSFNQGLKSLDPERIEIANGIAQAVALAIDNAQLYERSQKLAIMEERNRLAHEMHDGLAQKLTGVVLQLEAA